MTARSPLRVLFFDVFGTCVAQRSPVADELWKAAQEALISKDSSINSQVRAKAIEMSYEDWFDFGRVWNEEEDTFLNDNKAKTGNVDWKAVDQNRIEALPRLLARRGLVHLHEDANNSSQVRVAEGSLWDNSELAHLGRVWHRLPPWPDTCRGLELLNKDFSTVALSNTYNDLIKSLAAHSSIPFTEIYSADMFHSYKPNSKVYLGAAEKMGVKPEECALVAAHLGDLKGAKECGFYAIYVERALEEKNPELQDGNIPDVRIGEDEDGLVALAACLGAKID